MKFRIHNSTESFRIKKWGGEKEYVLNILNHLKDDDTLYDIGASVGLISVTAASLLTKGKVVSFEPDPEIASRLEANFKLNNLSNYIIKQIAVGEEKSVLQLYTEGIDSFSPSLKPVNKITRHIEVPVNSIDNLLSDNEIPPPTSVKIDIEGAEMLALKGMSKLLSSEVKPKNLFIEIHPDFLNDFNTSVTEIFRFLLDHNYHITNLMQRDRQIICDLSIPD